MSCPSARSGVAVRPSENLRLQTLEKSTIGRRLGVVELVDDDDVVGVGSISSIAIQGLDRREDVFADNRTFGSDVSLAERHLVQEPAEHLLALPKDLVAMRHEQQAIETLGSRTACSRRPKPKSCRFRSGRPRDFACGRVVARRPVPPASPVGTVSAQVDAGCRNGPRVAPMPFCASRAVPGAPHRRAGHTTRIRLVPVLLERRRDAIDDRALSTWLTRTFHSSPSSSGRVGQVR